MSKLVESTAVHNYQMQHVPFAGVFYLNVRAQPYEARHCPPSRPAGSQKQRRPAFFVQRVYVRALETKPERRT